MNWLQKVYWWLWYHFEWWLTPVDRRPFTFAMRDFFNLHPMQAWTYTGLWFVGMGFLLWYNACAGGILIGLSAFILAHVVWGAPWIKGQQEHPQYLGVWWDGEKWLEE
jgi:hypothetical protein